MDCSCSANYTLKKLIEARKRGVKVVLYLDDLNYSLDKNLVKELEKLGGSVVSLNPIAPYFFEAKFSTYKDMFARHHEKVSIADDRAIVGSSNIADDYSGPLYGSNDFLDLNAIMRNQCLAEIRQLFKDTAE
jgi:phosphatidylserine/phosphatidylglycerophosphate/cardiolipin synthase-like enzyme